MAKSRKGAFAAVLVTAGNAAEADRIANVLVRERLAACVNRVGPIRSTYTWKGKVARDEEYLLIIKARRACVKELACRVKELHSYDVPEVVALPIVGGSGHYLRWLAEVTGPTAR